MALVKQRIKNLVGGVSEAPDWQKKSSQVKEIINGLATPTRGLVKRPALSLLEVVHEGEITGASTHLVVRDGSFKYLIIFDSDNNALKVFDATTGVEKVVNGGSGVSYLSGATNLRFVTVGDTTYILNPAVTVGEDGSATAAHTDDEYDQALVWFKEVEDAATYGLTVYQLTIIGNYETHTASGTSPEALAQAFASDFNGDGGGTLVATADGPVLHLYSNDPAKRLVGVLSGHANITVIQRSVGSAAELPPEAPDGFYIQVSGDPATGTDNYWLVYSDADRRWIEAPAPDTVGALDPDTMPHLLTYDPATDEFTLAAGTWEERGAGDEESNPLPSFVDRPIEEIFFHQGRLGFTSGPAVVTSRAGEPLAFFRKATRSLQDNEPIDVESTRSAGFHSAVEWDERLYLFSETENFLLAGDPVLSPLTVRIDPVSSFGSHGGLRPTPAGDVVFLSRVLDEATQVVAWGKRNDSPAFGVDLTQDVPAYLEGTPVAAVGDPTLGFLAVATADGNPSNLFVCTYNVSGREGMPLASWATWEFEDWNILGTAMVDGRLLVLLSAPDQFTYLGEINVRRAFSRQGGEGAAGLDLGFYAFDFTVELANLHLRDAQDNVISNGRLTVHYLDVLLGKSTSLEAYVTPDGRSTRPSTNYAASPAEEGVLHIPIRAEGPKTTIVLKSFHTGNCAITGLLWEGDYHDEYGEGPPS